MKTVKEAKKMTKKIVKKTVKPVYTIKLTPDMTADELRMEFLSTKAKKKVPIKVEDLDFVGEYFYGEGFQDGLFIKGTIDAFGDVIKDFVAIATKPVVKKTPWYKKLWHFITFRGWK